MLLWEPALLLSLAVFVVVLNSSSTSFSCVGLYNTAWKGYTGYIVLRVLLGNIVFRIILGNIVLMVLQGYSTQGFTGKYSTHNFTGNIVLRVILEI